MVAALYRAFLSCRDATHNLLDERPQILFHTPNRYLAMRLLVVDDQGPVAAIISRIAEQGGWASFHTSSIDGLEAAIRHDKIDVLMIDYLIEGDPQGRTGLSLTEDLRHAGLTLPVILFSGAVQLIDEKRAAAAGVTKILEKPLSIRELRTSLNEAKKQISSAPAGPAAS